MTKADYIIADRGYHREDLRPPLNDKITIFVISEKNSIKGNENIDRYLYKYLHLFENVFVRPVHFRAIATRYDKLKRNFKGTVALACVFMVTYVKRH
ncbi:hypothetical protein AU255_05795 [Methyloprofundus sedimenti]|uniref:Transposase IS4-like domain-containing protein n=1 Tax=Methyloprofundus sedimenti TaxID=1420851 RepID=A0A1V8M783_9GAMM|nr:hypothetical protein AU255_05795 [Methyloprofundus sedimenti]